MDEILSSIRQIIADDDAAAVRRPAEETASVTAILKSIEPAPAAPAEEPLTLSSAQIVPEEANDDEAQALSAFAEEEMSADEEEELPPTFVDPEDVTFASDQMPEEEELAPEPPPQPAPRPVVAAPRPAPVAPMPPRPRPTAAEAAPMPDPTLASDIAEQLLEPTTKAAVRANFARLNQVGLATPGLTIEEMMREMMRPMLKQWLDEHLPAVVERMVEKEIARISRGLE